MDALYVLSVLGCFVATIGIFAMSLMFVGALIMRRHTNDGSIPGLFGLLLEFTGLLLLSIPIALPKLTHVLTTANGIPPATFFITGIILILIGCFFMGVLGNKRSA